VDVGDVAVFAVVHAASMLSVEVRRFVNFRMHFTIKSPVLVKPRIYERKRFFTKQRH
jgi:hypothetical protein